jgi:hypothetical protein
MLLFQQIISLDNFNAFCQAVTSTSVAVAQTIEFFNY